MSTKLRFLTASFVSLAVVTILFAMIGMMSIGHASAAQPCVVAAHANHFVVNNDKTITGYFEVTGDTGCKQDVSVMSWFADSTLFPQDEFYTSQTVNAVTTRSFGVGVHNLTVKLPLYASDDTTIHSYQADVIAGSVPADHINAPGTGGYYEQTQDNGANIAVDSKIAPGTCPVPTPPTTPTTTTPTAPTALPKTGTGSLVAIFSIAAVVAAGAHQLLSRRKAFSYTE